MAVSEGLTPEQLSRLPKYGRDYIGWLVMRLAETERAIAQLRAGPSDSNVLIEHYGDSPDQLLGRDTEVAFLLPTAAHPDGKVRVRHGVAGTIEVTCSGDRSGGGALHITPQSSNVARVRIGEY